MTPDEKKQAHREKMRHRIRKMKAICAHTVESCDSDAVVLIVSFADATETSVRMSTWGNAVLCKGMIDAARRRMAKDAKQNESDR